MAFLPSAVSLSLGGLEVRASDALQSCENGGVWGVLRTRRRAKERRSDQTRSQRRLNRHRRHMWEPLPRRQVRPRRLRYSEVVGEDDQPTGSQAEPGTEPAVAARARASDSKGVPGGNFRFEDHPADVIIHSWGESLEEAFAAAARGMFAYMTDLSRVEPKLEAVVKCSGSGDERSALEGFLEACLEEFNLRGVIPCRLEDVRLMFSADEKTWHGSARLVGDRFDRDKHSQGTEVKAITKSNTRVTSGPTGVDAYVIVDI